MLSPKGSESRIRISDWTRMDSMSRSARPNRRAIRLTGVTRSRSITPIRSSEIRLNPTPAAPNMPSCTSRPGTNTLYAPPDGNPRDADQRLQNADRDPGGVPDEQPEVAAEDKPGVARQLHAAVSRSDRPVWRRKTSSRLGRW